MIVSHEEYVELENGNSLILGENNSYLELEPLIFEDGFELFDKTIQELYFEDIFVYAYNGEEERFQFFLTELYLKLIDGNSRIEYSITGEKGSRNITVQYSNMGVFDYTYVDNSAVINAQLVIHEGSSTIEFTMGECSVEQELYDNGGLTIGLTEVHDVDEIIYATLINGSHAAPEINKFSLGYEDDLEVVPHIDRLPDSGTKYSFIREGVRTNDIEYINNLIYPNPVYETFSIHEKILEDYELIKVSDYFGKLVFQKEISSNIDFSKYPNGIYLVELIGKNETIRSRFMKM